MASARKGRKKLLNGLTTTKREFVKTDLFSVWHLVNQNATGLRCHASTEIQERVMFRVVRCESIPPRPMCLKCERSLGVIESTFRAY